MVLNEFSMIEFSNFSEFFDYLDHCECLSTVLVVVHSEETTYSYNFANSNQYKFFLKHYKSIPIYCSNFYHLGYQFSADPVVGNLFSVYEFFL